jgi:hypothetical protein
MGCSNILNVSRCFVAKAESTMIPSAPLSRSARALISLPDVFPTKVTLSVINGDHLFQIVSRGTGSESRVSSREYLFTIIDSLVVRVVLTDSAAVGRPKNPSR